ncbi:nucleotide-binding oligomerization domain-containing protein 2-like isoform X1 [Salvelinus fontinalis]|uniref:nucleotide-binding oligomerization domain-containing protein 2-like isoform X1 n=2 Tax=Salvelinus fontinalis TaxID=8038 RepID=UPI00248588FC|nr:nucleotide-binding oligomerization domain-containing protein 2-like isoform X1 [Salvelinus fontinalis]
MDETPQSLIPAQDSGPQSSITVQPTPPQSSITAQPTPPPSSITAQPTPPPSSITAQPTPPPSSITAQPTPPQSSITAQPAPPPSSITAQPTPPQSSITAQPAHPPSSIMAQPAHPPSSITAQPAHPPSSIMAQPAHPPSSIIAQPAHPPSSIMAQSAHPQSSITAQPAHPPSSIMAQPAHPQSSITAQPAHPPSSITAQPAHPPSSITAQPAPPQTSIMAQGGSVVVAPQLVGCIVAGSVYQHISVTIPSHGADEELPKVKDKHKSNMKKKFGSIFEGLGKRGNTTLLDKIYTELYITAGESEGVNKEHEVWQIEDTARTKAFQDDAINCNDIFRSLDPKTEEHNDKSQSKQEVPIRTVLTNGIAGIGKTVSVQKFILDWAEGIANQDVDFVFALPFRDLNLIKDDCNLLKLLSDFHPELTDMQDAKKVVDGKVVFIFDGLDESQLPLGFHNNKRLSNVTEKTSVDMLLTNLIKGNMLPEALLWITSRPAAVDKIPSDCFDRVTEVRGFNDPQKEEYFKKRFSDDENLASKIISHIKTSRSLHIMCHIPFFCWITAMVFGKMLSKNDHGKVPLTEIYIRFLLTLTNMKNKKYNGKNEPDPRNLSEPDVQIILKLGKLAFQNLAKSNLVFSEDYLRECGIDVNEAFLLSGMCTEIFREEDSMFQAKMYSFVHLTIQEFFAALYVAFSYASENVNPFCLRDYQELPRKNYSVSGDTYFGDGDDDYRDDDNRDDDYRDNDCREDDCREDDCREDDCRDNDCREDDCREDDFREDDFREDDLREDDLREDDFRDADCRDDDYRDADFRDADFRDADCRDDDYRDADFRDADFGDADFGGYDFGDADFRDDD